MTPTDATPTDATPTYKTPTDTTPTDMTPTDMTPTDMTPTDTTPTDMTPTEATPTDKTPTDTAPTDTTPTDATPTDTTPTDPKNPLQRPPDPSKPLVPKDPNRPDPRAEKGWDRMTETEKTSTITEYQTALAQKNQLLNSLASKYDAQAAYLGAQDVNYVESGDNENRFVGKVADFLNEVSRDQKNYETLQSGAQSLRDKLGSVVTKLDEILAKTDWNSQEQDKYGADEIAVGNLAYDNYVKSSAALADLSKDYVNKLDGTAAALQQAWEQTKHNEYKKELWSGINTVLDLMTGVGIGGNAAIQFAAKEFNEVKKSFDRFTNAYWLRGGQVGDLGQAAMNVGAGLKNFSSTTGNGPSSEIQGNTDSSTAHLNSLAKQFNDWITEYNKDHHGDPNPFVPV